jgi:hypothetical protein
MELNPSTPPLLGIMLIGIFWVIIGALIVSQTASMLSGSFSVSIIGLILILIGTGLIVVGWGLFTLRRWAFLTALILSILGTIPLFVAFLSFFIFLIESQGRYFDFGELSYLSVVFFFILFVWMSWYLLKKIKFLSEEGQHYF